MKAVVAAFNQEKALVGAFSVITNLRMELFEALLILTLAQFYLYILIIAVVLLLVYVLTTIFTLMYLLCPCGGDLAHFMRSYRSKLKSAAKMEVQSTLKTSSEYCEIPLL